MATTQADYAGVGGAINAGVQADITADVPQMVQPEIPEDKVAQFVAAAAKAAVDWLDAQGRLK